VAETRRFLDVWIIETNTVYKQVPYTVVTDWVQQGRLLADDKLRPSGTPQWTRVGDMPVFVAFLPKADPYRAEDQAEALEPVQVDFAWKKPHDEDDDVDMIPLIDISLVLLIFFMMTATVGSAASIFNTPQAKYKLLQSEPEMVWVGIKRDDNGQPRYFMGWKEVDKGQEYGSREELIQAFANGLDEHTQSGPVKVNIQADQQLPFRVVSDMTTGLTKYKAQGKVAYIYGGVNEQEDR
jgi:biopolymer transport protein ExbD